MDWRWNAIPINQLVMRTPLNGTQWVRCNIFCSSDPNSKPLHVYSNCGLCSRNKDDVSCSDSDLWMKLGCRRRCIYSIYYNNLIASHSSGGVTKLKQLHRMIYLFQFTFHQTQPLFIWHQVISIKQVLGKERNGEAMRGNKEGMASKESRDHERIIERHERGEKAVHYIYAYNIIVLAIYRLVS